MTIRQDKRKAIFISLFCMFLWGSAIPMIKMQYEFLSIVKGDIGSRLLVAGIRFFIAGLITIFYFKIFNREEKVDFKNLNYRFLIKIALLQITLHYIFYYTGLFYTKGVKASVIQSFNAFIIVIFSALLIKGDGLNKRKLLALCIGTIGIIYVNSGGDLSTSFSLLGEGAIIMAITLNGLATVLVKKEGAGINSFVISTFQFCVGCIPLIVIGLMLKQTVWTINIKGILLIIYGGFVSSTAFTLWYMVLKNQSAGEFGIYKLFVPIFGSILSVIILGEDFNIRLLIGFIMVIIGVLVLNKKL
ncbi:Permease of the drug/metabolite transporter (DMT) superfamily [Peptoniphilus asaccharolyticus DSM 20463]|uniref:Permease of the drug/metabolite transporter (DMT) superfamily n=1 Tax=Peptoniphilus asaccharolyticus DSM 20463 TaxID=573058 RepID=A0A1W1UVV8_PEPAS|nr:DMT family transporter [Peptoniphilus asaccharolyticus]MBL7575209.1 DMT family transporter [Peptoniphilus asaccharolyticus]SMB84824.1 Permease of the drug/metabolite transporter (DMT) superfamily [Peptoniphilus asaccharolyticus DSM 20463]